MVNKVILIGNLGQDPEKRFTQSGTAVTTINMATSRRWKNPAGEAQEETEWHRVVVWGKTAEYCGEYLQKGSKIYVEGRLKTNKWQDQAGTDRYTTEVVADTVQNLTPRTGAASAIDTPAAPPQQAYAGPTKEQKDMWGDDDDVPF